MITIILVAIAAVCNGFMDMILNMHATSVFSDTTKYNPLFWDPTVSWKNKYKNGDRTQGEKFLGSTTCFVCFTDAWHLFKMLFQILILAAILIPAPLFTWYYMAGILALLWGGVFELTIRVLTK